MKKLLNCQENFIINVLLYVIIAKKINNIENIMGYDYKKIKDTEKILCYTGGRKT